MARLRGSRLQTDVLVVCTGNICRSPYIAEKLRGRAPNLVIQSAGTNAIKGASPDRRIIEELRREGEQVPESPAQKASKALVRSSSLIICAARAHRVAVVSMDPSAAERAFTLKEVARILQKDSSVVGLRAVLRAASRAAHESDPIDHDDDLDDPVGLDEPAYARMFFEVNAAVDVIGPALRGPA